MCCLTEMSDPFVSGVTWVGSCLSGGFVWKHVVSLKTLLLLRDVTGKALLSSAVVWFCFEMESVVTLLVLRRLQSLWMGFLSRVKARVQRTVRVVLSQVGGRVARTGRERFAHWHLAFKQTDLDPPTGGCSNQCVRVGQSPACTAPLARHMITRHLIFNSKWKIYTGLLYLL